MSSGEQKCLHLPSCSETSSGALGQYKLGPTSAVTLCSCRVVVFCCRRSRVKHFQTLKAMFYLKRERKSCVCVFPPPQTPQILPPPPGPVEGRRPAALALTPRWLFELYLQARWDFAGWRFCILVFTLKTVGAVMDVWLLVPRSSPAPLFLMEPSSQPQMSALVSPGCVWAGFWGLFCARAKAPPPH